MAAVVLAGWPAAASDGPLRRSLAVDGGERHFWIERTAGAGAAPVVVLLQGALEEPLAFAAATGLPELARRERFTLVVPETGDGHWNDGRRTVYFGAPSTADDLGFLDRLLAQLVAEGTARPDAVYLAGFSNGGLMALTLACRPGPVRLAGLVAAAATLGEATAATCRPSVPLALVLANGTADALFPYAGGSGMVNGRPGEPMLAAATTAAFFAHANGCGQRRELAAGPEPMGRGTAVAVAGYDGCPAAGQGPQVTVTGAGHAWPPGSVAALGKAAQIDGPASLAELAWTVFRGRVQ